MDGVGQEEVLLSEKREECGAICFLFRWLGSPANLQIPAQLTLGFTIECFSTISKLVV